MGYRETGDKAKKDGDTAELAPSPAKKPRKLEENTSTAFPRLVADSTAKLHKQPGAVKPRLLSNKCTAEDAQATDSSDKLGHQLTLSKSSLFSNKGTAEDLYSAQSTVFSDKLGHQLPLSKSRLLSNADTDKLRQNSEPSTSRKQELVCSCTKASEKGVKGCFSCSICGKVQHKICQTFMPLPLCNGCHARKIGMVSRKQTTELKNLPVKTKSTKFVSEKKKIELDSSKTDKLSRRMECLELEVTKIRKNQVSYESVIRSRLAHIEADLKLIFEWILKKKKQ